MNRGFVAEWREGTRCAPCSSRIGAAEWTRGKHGGRVTIFTQYLTHETRDPLADRKVGTGRDTLIESQVPDPGSNSRGAILTLDGGTLDRLRDGTRCLIEKSSKNMSAERNWPVGRDTLIH